MANGTDLRLIWDKEEELKSKFPIEANYGSKCSLWAEGLRADIVDEELYNKARDHYGRLWNYAGD